MVYVHKTLKFLNELSQLYFINIAKVFSKVAAK